MENKQRTESNLDIDIVKAEKFRISILEKELIPSIRIKCDDLYIFHLLVRQGISLLINLKIEESNNTFLCQNINDEECIFDIKSKGILLVVSGAIITYRKMFDLNSLDFQFGFFKEGLNKDAQNCATWIKTHLEKQIEPMEKVLREHEIELGIP